MNEEYGYIVPSKPHQVPNGVPLVGSSEEEREELSQATGSPVFKRRLATGPTDDPFEALVISHQDRLVSNVRLLHSAFFFIPQIRAPPIDAECPDRDFAYRKAEELHNRWIKRVELPVVQPALELTHKISGSCPPMQSFDPAKMLTDSGKLQTLDILLKRLRAGNHRVLLVAQMTKIYLSLDGSSTIIDRRDMVNDFQLRNDIFVFLLSTRAGGVGINLTAADTVTFYESDWNPTLDLQAMDRAHRLGQTKDVTVYRLICKETVEEKILHRASQKSTVQQLVMTGGHIQGDILAPEDVISLLIDDAQMEQKLKDIPAQVKDRQRRKGRAKAIRIDEEGDARLEDITDPEPPSDPFNTSPSEKPSSSKKRKGNTEKGPAKARAQKGSKNPNSTVTELDNTDVHRQKPKRPTKSVNENLEPAFTAISRITLLYKSYKSRFTKSCV
ncbi:unnamed protein product [Lactuca virosa]|uniref:Chromatin-remodeling ATPase INO80 n=1 Tax=Lactuca virosa TaxID=75947 RepID=A0AAU9M2P1_9ASTR|nr:unnamed protein product [Lactuca virosa]